MQNFSEKISTWVVSEGLAGTENQCLGVAEALGVEAEIQRINLRQPWKSLSPYIGFEQSWSFKPSLKVPPDQRWPELAILSGRKSIAAARYIKKASGGKTFTVQIQDPRVDPGQFDLVAVPDHDPTRGDNIIITTASPNRITAEKLEESKAAFPQFGELDNPRVAVLIGGNSKAYNMSAEIARTLAAQLQHLDASLMITASRRTGEENTQILKNALSDHYFWGGAQDNKGENPYFALLAWADFIMVTADSASMLSEACTTGKPVYMISMDGGHPRIDKLHENLRQLGCLRNFEGNLEAWSYEPLNDASMIADEIRKRLKKD